MLLRGAELLVTCCWEAGPASREGRPAGAPGACRTAF